MNRFLSLISVHARTLREHIIRVFHTFSHKEKLSFELLAFVFVIGVISLLYQINSKLLVEVPRHGGSYTEGIIGVPRFINPLLAISDADRDLTSLVYSGLVRPIDGQLVPDLAESYSISEDGRVYTFILRENISFHDGTAITTEDVEFTIKSAQDPLLRSTKRASWDDVKIEKINDREIHFTLKQPYAPFLENTALGILPKHIWKNAAPEEFPFSQFNINPIGSGPYKIENIIADSSGIPEYYELSSFGRFSPEKPYIDNISINLYPNEETLVKALESGEIEGASAISSHIAKTLENDGFSIVRSPLPRVFAVFFNQNKNTLFTDASIREALALAVDRETIVSEVLSGYGTVITGPIPPGALGYTPDTAPKQTHAERIQLAKEKIEKGGWKWNEETRVFERTVKKEVQKLTFSLSTSDNEDLKETATLLKRFWEEIGVPVDLKIFAENDLRQSVIRPREFDVLLFGQVIGRESDLYSFWHSSQRNDPGLNVGLYANIKADKALSEARVLSNREDRIKQYETFAGEIEKDTPAIFLYAPDFLYAFPAKRVHGLSLLSAAIPSDRWNTVGSWFIETDKVWKFFLTKKNNQ